MKRNRYIIGLMLGTFFVSLFMNLTICRAEISVFKPEWKIGDSWKVESVARSEPLADAADSLPKDIYGDFLSPSFLIFKIVEIKDIGGEECFEVKVSGQEDNKEQPLTYLYYTTDTLKLKAAQKIYENNARGFLEYPYEKNGPTVEAFMFGLWVSWPDFTQLVPADSSKVFPRSTAKIKQDVEINGDILKVTWYLFYNETDNSWSSSITQVWRKGNPWWDSYELADSKQIVDVPGRDGYIISKAHSIFTSDSQSPQISLSLIPDTLWPANHQMVEIKPQITVSDNQDPSPVVTLESVTSSEPDDAPGVGDGNTTGDIQVTPDGKIFLRAERDGNGTGRIYTITYTAEDASGNKASVSAAVTVPHSQGKDKK